MIRIIVIGRSADSLVVVPALGPSTNRTRLLRQNISLGANVSLGDSSVVNWTHFDWRRRRRGGTGTPKVTPSSRSFVTGGQTLGRVQNGIRGRRSRLILGHRSNHHRHMIDECRWWWRRCSQRWVPKQSGVATLKTGKSFVTPQFTFDSSSSSPFLAKPPVLMLMLLRLLEGHHSHVLSTVCLSAHFSAATVNLHNADSD